MGFLNTGGQDGLLIFFKLIIKKDKMLFLLSAHPALPTFSSSQAQIPPW